MAAEVFGQEADTPPMSGWMEQKGIMAMPVIVLNSSPKSPELAPAPDDAMLILPGWALA